MSSFDHPDESLNTNFLFINQGVAVVSEEFEYHFTSDSIQISFKIQFINTYTNEHSPVVWHRFGGQCYSFKVKVWLPIRNGSSKHAGGFSFSMSHKSKFIKVFFLV